MEEKILKQIKLIKDTWNNFIKDIEFVREIDKKFLFSMKKNIDKIDVLKNELKALIFEKNNIIDNKLNKNPLLNKDRMQEEKNKWEQ